MKPDPFDMLRAYTSGTEMQQELAAARATIAALRKELAEAQENYHVTNSLAAKVRAENEEIHADYEALANEHTKLTERHRSLRAEVERLRKAGDAMAKSIGFEYRDSPLLSDWNAAKEGKPSDA